MTDGISPAAQQGVLSTQLEQVQTGLAVERATQAQQVVQPPPAPPPESGRGTNLDTSV